MILYRLSLSMPIPIQTLDDEEWRRVMEGMVT